MLRQMSFVQKLLIIIRTAKIISEIYMNRIPLLLTLSVIMLFGIILTILLR